MKWEQVGLAFFLGMTIGTVIMLWAHLADQPNAVPHREATLPAICRPTEKIIMTSASQAEYFECEAHWVRK